MFSRKPRAPEHHWEIIYASKAFTWQEDGSLTEQRRRQERKRWFWTTCLGLTLALLVLGNAVGVSWLFSAVASGEATSVSLK